MQMLKVPSPEEVIQLVEDAPVSVKQNSTSREHQNSGALAEKLDNRKPNYLETNATKSFQVNGLSEDEVNQRFQCWSVVLVHSLGPDFQKNEG